MRLTFLCDTPESWDKAINLIQQILPLKAGGYLVIIIGQIYNPPSTLGLCIILTN